MSDLHLRSIKEECEVMAAKLRILEEEELSLKAQNEILARHIVDLGHRGDDHHFADTVTGVGDPHSKRTAVSTSKKSKTNH